MLTLVSKDSVKNSDHFDVLCVLIACMVLEIINQNQMSKNQKSSLIVWNTVPLVPMSVARKRSAQFTLFKHAHYHRKGYVAEQGASIRTSMADMNRIMCLKTNFMQ